MATVTIQKWYLFEGGKSRYASASFTHNLPVGSEYVVAWQVAIIYLWKLHWPSKSANSFSLLWLVHRAWVVFDSKIHVAI